MKGAFGMISHRLKTRLPAIAFVSLITIGFSLNAFVSGESSSALKTKSGKFSKFETFEQSSVMSGRVYGKAASLMPIEIRSLGSEEAGPGDPIELEAVVEATTDLQDLQYNWIIPKGVSTNGPIKGDLGILQRGERTTLRLSAVKETRGNRQIHLHVYRMVNGEASGQMAQYNTAHERKIKEKARMTAEEFRKARGSDEPLEIFQ
jgi:hypothetical protein